MPFLGSAKDKHAKDPKQAQAAQDAKDLAGAAQDAKDIHDSMNSAGITAGDVKQGAAYAAAGAAALRSATQAAAAQGVTAEDVKKGAVMVGTGAKKGFDLAQSNSHHLDMNKDGKIDQEDFKRMAADIKQQRSDRKDDLVVPLYVALLLCLVQTLTYGLQLKFDWMGVCIGSFVVWFFAWKGVMPDEYTMYLAGLFFVWDGVSILLDVLYMSFLFLAYDSFELMVHGWIFYTIKNRHGIQPNEKTPLGP